MTLSSYLPSFMEIHLAVCAVLTRAEWEKELCHFSWAAERAASAGGENIVLFSPRRAVQFDRRGGRFARDGWRTPSQLSRLLSPSPAKRSPRPWPRLGGERRWLPWRRRASARPYLPLTDHRASATVAHSRRPRWLPAAPGVVFLDRKNSIFTYNRSDLTLTTWK